MPAASLEREVLAALDPHRLVEQAQALIAVRTDGGEETPAQELMAAFLEEAGLRVDVWSIDLERLRRDADYSAEIDRPRALGVVGILGDGAGPTLVLNGHVDVVPPGDPERWSVHPFRPTLRDGELLGRGAADMKGGLAAGLAALRAVHRAGVPLRGRVVFHSVVGEEDGGLGTLAALERGHTGDAALVLEPTGLDIGVVQSGCLNFRLTLPGRAAHGALRHEGHSPLEDLSAVLARLGALEEARNAAGDPGGFFAGTPPVPISVGVIRGGSWPSAVPESLVLEGRYGVLVGETFAEARAAFERALDGLDPAPHVAWWGGRYRPAATDPETPVVRVLADAVERVRGRAPRLVGAPFGSDLGLLATRGGMPAALFGPGDIRRAHAPDEGVKVDELVDAARALALTVTRFVGSEP
ncbi:MAG: ArgE/DapE family deacylase [Gemmatimonadetes bacterium]|nr:MAG: ArgE/DapE family deacylase [Gemmatimonadota bacterium]